MIVHIKKKCYQTRSDKPNENWLDKDWAVVDDNSKLAEKIRRLYPYYEIILENNVIIDVIEKEKDEDEIKKEKEREIKNIEAELKRIDKNTGVTRILEDIITHTGIYALLHSDAKQVIEKKKTLREKREKIVKDINIKKSQNYFDKDDEDG